MSKPLPEAQVKQLSEQLKAGKVLFLLDYDGTHAPFVPDPKQAAADPMAKEMLIKLQEKFPNALVFITGRPVDELDELIELDRLEDGQVQKGDPVTLQFNVAGEHGADMRLGDQRSQLITLSEEQICFIQATHTHTTEFIEKLLERHGLNPGDIFIEEKDRSFAVHWRPVTEKDSQTGALVEAEVTTFLNSEANHAENPVVTLPDATTIPSFVEHPGDCNCEFKLNSKLVSKGIVCKKIIDLPQYANKDMIVFIGDDFPGTDGYASEVVNALTDHPKGLSIQVLSNPDKYIETGPKAPHYTLDSPAQLGAFWASIYAALNETHC